MEILIIVQSVFQIAFYSVATLVGVRYLLRP